MTESRLERQRHGETEKRESGQRESEGQCEKETQRRRAETKTETEKGLRRERQRKNVRWMILCMYDVVLYCMYDNSYSTN